MVLLLPKLHGVCALVSLILPLDGSSKLLPGRSPMLTLATDISVMRRRKMTSKTMMMTRSMTRKKPVRKKRRVPSQVSQSYLI